jgi:hypothetical protein
VDPEQPVYNVKPLEEIVSNTIQARRLGVWLLVAFALSALSLASVGIYGVVSHSVTRRTSTPAAATAAWTVGLGTGLVDIQRAPIQVAAIDRGNRLLGFCIVSHLYKPKASGLPGVTIGTDVDTVYGSVSFKQGSDGCFRHPKTEVAYENVLHN